MASIICERCAGRGSSKSRQRKAEQGRLGLGFCPAEGWWTSSLTPTQSLILPNEEEESQSIGSLFILFISLHCSTSLCVQVCGHGHDRDKDRKRWKRRWQNFTSKYQTILIVQKDPFCMICIFLGINATFYIFYSMSDRTRKRKCFSDLFCSAEKRRRDLCLVSRGLKSQGQCSLSKLRRGLAHKTSGPVSTHILSSVYIHAVTVAGEQRKWKRRREERSLERSLKKGGVEDRT